MLAPGLIKIQTILASDRQPVGAAWLCEVSQIKRKGRVSAGMSAQKLPVQPYIGIIIHRAKVQQATGSHFIRQREFPFIPHNVAMLAASYAGETALIRKGHLNLLSIRQ